MKKINPEQAGVSSDHIIKFLNELDDYGLSTHDMILGKGNDIFFEEYWDPFSKNDLHRVYSVSKSFVAIAVGFLQQDGRIDINDRILKYFPEEEDKITDKNLQKQTIKDMMMMCTAGTPVSWLELRPDDMVKHYFEAPRESSRPPGTIFEYDSTGTFVVGAMVERVTGKPFMDYLREKLFDKIGVTKQARCMKCPGGHSWGDSAVLCTPMDLYRVARFVLNFGTWKGERLLNEEYLRAATSKLVDNNIFGINNYDTQGYGYYIWRTYEDSFALLGMGCQLAVCVPHKDMIMVYNGDNLGSPAAEKVIIDHFFRYIVHNDDKIVETVPGAGKRLKERCGDLKIPVATGNLHSEYADMINGREYVLDENRMGMKWFRFYFEKDRGSLVYENEQGEKKLDFGMGKNLLVPFPQEGYSDEYAIIRVKGHYFRCASSAAWVEPHKIRVKVQILDKYFGRLDMIFSFTGDEVGIYMEKTAEDSLNEYAGKAGGRRKQ